MTRTEQLNARNTHHCAGKMDGLVLYLCETAGAFTIYLENRVAKCVETLAKFETEIDAVDAYYRAVRHLNAQSI